MFTQCSKCETVFRLSAEVLRAAGGQVRCGRCGEVFNGLSRLAEDATGFIKGESPLFLETRADEILESSSSDLSEASVEVGSSQAVGEAQHGDELDPPGVEIAQLQFIGPVDDELAEETSLEFTLPPGELDRIFIETRPSPLRQLADGYRTERADVTPLHPEASSAESMPVPTPPTQTPPATPLEAPLEAPLSRITGLEVSEEVRQEMLSSFRADTVRHSTPAPPPSRPPSRFPTQSPVRASRARLSLAAWLTAAVLLGILLLIQVVHDNSDWVSAHVPLLGGSGSTANLSVYQLRQWGVTGDPGAKGTLRVRASIMNTAPQLQPYPLLRVTLANRFGTRVGAREFGPAEYLGHGVARMLTPGERVDATLDILDPGKDAEGFEIDVCIRSANGRVACAGDAAARTQ